MRSPRITITLAPTVRDYAVRESKREAKKTKKSPNLSGWINGVIAKHRDRKR